MVRPLETTDNIAIVCRLLAFDFKIAVIYALHGLTHPAACHLRKVI